jgi:cytochrome c biogenesis protein CcdA
MFFNFPLNPKVTVTKRKGMVIKIKLNYLGIIRKLLIITIILMTFSSCLNAFASSRRTDIVYFYITVCKPCNEAQKAMEQINKETAAFHPNVLMHNIENTDNLKLLNRYYDYYKVPQKERQLPCIFVGKTYLAGESSIQTGLRFAITQDGSATPLLKATPLAEDPAPKYFGLIGTFFTGLLNGFNPCALSMLLFFISLLIAQKGNILRSGLAFCGGKFLMFLALGTILYQFLSAVNPAIYTSIVKVLLLMLVLLVTALNVSDFFATRKEHYGKVKMQLPLGLRKRLNIFVRNLLEGKTGRYVILISFITGAVVTVGEFLCTGQLYLAAIIFNIREYGSLNLYAFFALVIYDIGFVLPLLVLVLAIQRGRLIFELSETLRAKLPAIKLATAGIFLVYGLIFLIFL